MCNQTEPSTLVLFGSSTQWHYAFCVQSGAQQKTSAPKCMREIFSWFWRRSTLRQRTHYGVTQNTGTFFAHVQNITERRALRSRLYRSLTSRFHPFCQRVFIINFPSQGLQLTAAATQKSRKHASEETHRAPVISFCRRVCAVENIHAIPFFYSFFFRGWSTRCWLNRSGCFVVLMV